MESPDSEEMKEMELDFPSIKGSKKRPGKHTNFSAADPYDSEFTLTPENEPKRHKSTHPAHSQNLPERNSHKISVSAMLELMDQRGFSFRDMRAIMKSFRKETGDTSFFESGFEEAAFKIHKTFEDLFKGIEFFGEPAVFCSDVHQMLERLQEIHKRKIEHVNIGVDDGKGNCILWFMFFLFFIQGISQ